MTAQQIAAGLKAHARRTSTAWQASTELSFDEWKAAGPALGLQTRASGWWLGDWVRFGGRHYGLAVSDAAAITGYEEQTLYNMVSVAAKFTVSRRREKLSWSHHADLAALTPEEQDIWLNRAQDEGLSVVELRKALRRSRRTPSTPRSAKGHGQASPALCPYCGGVVEAGALGPRTRAPAV